MDTVLIAQAVVFTIGAVMLFTKKLARWGGLVIGLGFIPLGYYQYLAYDQPLYAVGGMVLAAIAVYRFFRPREK